MTTKKIIAYTAMVVVILSLLCALGSSIGITLYVFNIFQESDKLHETNNETSQSFQTEKGLLIAGGTNGSVLDSIEMFSLTTLTSCVVNVKLDGPRKGHIGVGDVVCGGIGNNSDYNDTRLTTCYNIVTGAKGRAYIMYNNKRNVHTSWSTDDGIYLISGYPSGRTSDIIKTDGTTQEGFKLRVDSRFTCSIPEDDDDTLIITGSWDKPTNRVDKYSKDGFLEALPSLNEGRRSHGCGSYVDSFNQRIYLVAGGFENYGEGFRSSTELLVKDGVAWTLYENSLPSRMYDVASVSLNNEIFLSGGKEGRSSREVYDSILQFQKKEKKFSLIGSIKQGRQDHSMTVGSITDYQCI